MTAVYVDPQALCLPAPPVFPTQKEAEPVPAPGAAEALKDLSEAGYAVYVIAPPQSLLDGLALDVETVSAAPSTAASGTWLITSDQSDCVGRQGSGLRTILIGPRTVSRSVTSVRCDHEARDFRAAVMDILAEDVMGTATRPPAANSVG